MLLLLLLAAALTAQAQLAPPAAEAVASLAAEAPSLSPAAALGEEVRGLELDAGAAFRVRDLALRRDELHIYFNDGWLVFAKPVAGRRLAAVFIRSDDAGDAEVLLMPPTSGERISLARFAGAPNLNEHFDLAVLVFTDRAGEELFQAAQARGAARGSAEMGLLAKARYDSTLGNLAAGLRVWLIEHLLSERPLDQGFLYVAVRGRKQGSFDLLYDPSEHQQIFVGQLVHKDENTFYDTWTHFAGRSFRSGQRQPPEPQFRVDKYRIQALLAPNLNLRVHTTASVAPRTTLRVLPFHMTPRMTVESVLVNGEPAEVLTSDALRADLIGSGQDARLLVVPATPLEPGASYEVEFQHSGGIITNSGGDVYYVGSRGSWYPRAADSFSTFDITFTHPSSLDLLFPGVVQEERSEGGLKTTRRVTGEPIRMAAFNLGKFDRRKETRGPLTVELYANREVEGALRPQERVLVLPESLDRPINRPRGFPMPRLPNIIVTLPPPPSPDPTARLESLSEEVAFAFDYFSELFGPPALPQLMVSPIPRNLGQGFPGLVYLSTLSYLDPKDRPAAARNSANQNFFFDLLHAHETAHQWWGNVVATTTNQDDWLMEAMASYSALLVLEKKKGPNAMREVLAQYRLNLLEPDGEAPTRESIGPVRLGGRLDNSLAPGAWRTVIYEKGAWIIHMLRQRMGDRAFLDFLGDFTRGYRSQSVTTEMFQKEAARRLPEGARDQSLDDFFDSWVNGTGVPALKLTTSTSGKAPKLQLRVTVEQSGVEAGFTTLVPVEIKLPGGKAQTVWLETGVEPATQTVVLNAAPVAVELDPHNAVLKR